MNWLSCSGKGHWDLLHGPLWSIGQFTPWNKEQEVWESNCQSSLCIFCSHTRTAVCESLAVTVIKKFPLYKVHITTIHLLAICLQLGKCLWKLWIAYRNMWSWSGDVPLCWCQLCWCDSSAEVLLYEILCVTLHYTYNVAFLHLQHVVAAYWALHILCFWALVDLLLCSFMWS